MNLKNKVKTSLIWTFGDQVVTQFVFVLFGVFLARILSPSTFGIVSMVVIFTNFAALFIDMGFGAALIQKKDADNEHYSSVFWLNLAIGALLYLVFFFTAPFLSVFYHEPQITSLVRVICLSFIINALSSIQSNLLIRDLKFKQKVIINWISMMVGYSVAFYLAYKNYGAWAIVWMTLATALVNTILYWLSSKWYPNFRFNIHKIKELSSFGFNVLGDTTVNYWSRNFDNFLIARVLGSTELGLYTRAYSLMLLPLRNISTVITKVMFPAFSKKQDDIQSIKLYYLKIIKFISLLTFPAMIGLSLVSKEFVLLFFGASWSGMIGVLSVLSLVGTFQSVFSLNGMIYNSLGKADIAFKVSIVVNTVLIIAFLIGINFGIIGMAWSYLIASLLLFYPIYNSVIKLLTIKWIEVFIATKGVLISTFIMAIMLLLFNRFLMMSLISSFVLKISIGILFYSFSLFFFEKELIDSFKQKGMKLISRR